MNISTLKVKVLSSNSDDKFLLVWHLTVVKWVQRLSCISIVLIEFSCVGAAAFKVSLKNIFEVLVVVIYINILILIRFHMNVILLVGIFWNILQRITLKLVYWYMLFTWVKLMGYLSLNLTEVITFRFLRRK